MKKKVYLIPNLITALGLASGLLVIFRVNFIDSHHDAAPHFLFTSLLLLLLAALADLLDGAIARIIRAESEFGFNFDALADAISFGVAPSVLLLRSLSLQQGTGVAFFAVSGAMIYSICGVFRLVRFNVNATQARGVVEEEIDHKKNFTGLPIPAAAIAAVSTNLFFYTYRDRYDLSDQLLAILLGSIWIGLGFLMVSRWKFPSIKSLHFRVPSLQLILATVFIAIFFLYGILHFFSIMLMSCCWGYICLGVVLSVTRMIIGKRRSTLEDFEIEEEE